MKRFIFIALAITFCLAGKAYEWTDENGTVWTFNVSNGNARLYKGWNSPCISGTIPANLVIPATVYSGETAYPVTAIGSYAFYGCSSLTSINIPEGVTAIGGAAFQNCSSLTSINIPEGVTAIETSAFEYCI